MTHTYFPSEHEEAISEAHCALRPYSYIFRDGDRLSINLWNMPKWRFRVVEYNPVDAYPRQVRQSHHAWKSSAPYPYLYGVQSRSSKSWLFVSRHWHSCMVYAMCRNSGLGARLAGRQARHSTPDFRIN